MARCRDVEMLRGEFEDASLLLKESLLTACWASYSDL